MYSFTPCPSVSVFYSRVSGIMCVCTALLLPLSLLVGLPFYAVAPSSFDAKAVVKLYAYAPISGAPRTYMDITWKSMDYSN